MKHITVLQREAVDGLDISHDDIVVDATFGSGGHAREIVQKLGSTGCYIGIDADPSAFTMTPRLETKATVHLVNNNFRNLTDILGSLQIENVNAILADLGWRTQQFTEGERGFSFQRDEPLIMTFGDASSYPFTADDIINEWEEYVLADIFFGYGEERYARRIARAIVESRESKPIKSTLELVALIESALPSVAKRQKIHPATRTFQALRIAVNDELGALEEFMAEGMKALQSEGRFAIITFHSIEDRIVKRQFREFVKEGNASYIDHKFITPTKEELAQNPRSRSAKLRIITKT